MNAPTHSQNPHPHTLPHTHLPHTHTHTPTPTTHSRTPSHTHTHPHTTHTLAHSHAPPPPRAPLRLTEAQSLPLGLNAHWPQWSQSCLRSPSGRRAHATCSGKALHTDGQGCRGRGQPATGSGQGSPGSEPGAACRGQSGSGTPLHLQGPTLEAWGPPALRPGQACCPQREAHRPAWAPSVGLGGDTVPGRWEPPGPWALAAQGSGLGPVQGGSPSRGWLPPWSRCLGAIRAGQAAQLSLRMGGMLRGQQDGGWGWFPGGREVPGGACVGPCPWEALAEARPALAQEQPRVARPVGDGGMGGAVGGGHQGRWGLGDDSWL